MAKVKINGREWSEIDKNAMKAANKVTIGFVVISFFSIFAFAINFILGIGVFFIGFRILKPALQQLAKAQKEAFAHKAKNIKDLHDTGALDELKKMSGGSDDSLENSDLYEDFSQEYEEENAETIQETLEAQQSAKKTSQQTTTELVVVDNRVYHIIFSIFLISVGVISREFNFEYWLLVVIAGGAWFLFRGIRK